MIQKTKSQSSAYNRSQDTIKKNITIDWTLKESVQAKLKVMVKRILRKYGYPPDKQKKATETVLEQAKVICNDLVN